MALGPEQVFAQYIVGRKIVVADASSVSRSSIAQCLSSLGARTSDLALAASFEAAESEIDRFRPSVVICDYDLGRGRGLDLLQKQRAARAGAAADALFILVTGNTSQSAVARAAEEDVDNYIVKPFTAASLKAAILKAAMGKLQPPAYLAEIELGKVALQQGRFDDAVACFQKAKGLDPAPSLACYYLGQAHMLKRAYEGALEDFTAGLEYNQIHYKCLVGLFELLMARGEHRKAYDIIKRMAHYFPANPQRMTAVLRLAIQTGHYADVERYYEIFKGMETRTEDIVRHICAALVVCGKYFLQQGQPDRALELFQKAAATGQGRTRLLREIILSLCDHGLPEKGDEFLQKFQPEAQKSVDYAAANILLADRILGRSHAIVRAREGLKQGHHDPLIYRILITRSYEAGYSDSADELIRAAITRWPDQKAEFERLAPNPS